jgi:uncharacterized protein (DUF779 family)
VSEQSSAVPALDPERHHTASHVMKLSVTERAAAVVRRVEDAGREDLVMVLGTGCCDSTAPFLYDRYYPGPDVREVGRVEGVSIYAQAWLADLYGRGRRSIGLELDVDEGVPNDSFSLESELDCRFTLRVMGFGARAPLEPPPVTP